MSGKLFIKRDEVDKDIFQAYRVAASGPVEYLFPIPESYIQLVFGISDEEEKILLASKDGLLITKAQLE